MKDVELFNEKIFLIERILGEEDFLPGLTCEEIDTAIEDVNRAKSVYDLQVLIGNIRKV